MPGTMTRIVADQGKRVLRGGFVPRHVGHIGITIVFDVHRWVEDRALAIYASLIGAMVLARAVDDSALSKQILQAMAASV